MKMLFISVFLMSFSATAMMKKASIDGALSHKYDENYEETQRSLASQSEKPQPSSKEDSAEKGDRVPSSHGKSFDQLNENGVRYWKY